MMDSSITPETIDEVYQQTDYSDILNKYKDPATVYAYLVLSGKQTASYMTKLGCYRHLQDLKRVEEHQVDFPFHYDLRECHKILNFAKICPDVNTNKPLPLMAWQKYILCQSVGWRDDLDHKRFTKVHISVARTNGKTYLTQILLWYAYIVETGKRHNQDMAYVAPVFTQVKKGWRYVKGTGNYLKALEVFRKGFFKPNEVAVQDEQVKSEKTQNQILRMSNESGQFDSYHFLYAIVDEAGDPKITKQDNISKLTTGQVNTPNHQLIMISTAYDSANSIFYRDEQRIKTAMENDEDRSEDDYLCLVWTQDSFDETDHPETWIKSNPILGMKNHESLLKSLIGNMQSSKASGELRKFQNRNLNLWLQIEENSYVKLQDLQAAVIKNEDFNIDHQIVYIGYDKGQYSDDCSFSFVFPYNKNGKSLYHVTQYSFVPLANADMSIEIKEHQDGIDYQNQCNHGYGQITKNKYGLVIDDETYAWLMNYVKEHGLQVKGFLYDQYHADKIVKLLEANSDWNIIPVRQGAPTLNDPTVFFREELIQHHITTFDDGILQYSMLNARLFQSNNGVKIDKDIATSKIDCVDAIIDAFYEAQYYFEGLTNQKEKKSPWGNRSADEINDYLASDDFSF